MIIRDLHSQITQLFFTSSPFSSPHMQIMRRKATLLVLALCSMLVLTACGPESSSESDEALVQETYQIAQDFAASGNLDAARQQLDAMAVANDEQWLVYVAETAIATNADPVLTAALVQLSDALGLDSATLDDYALQNNLLEGLAAAAEAAPALVEPAVVVVAPTEEGAAMPDSPSTTASVAVAPASEGEPAAADEADAAAEGDETAEGDDADGEEAEGAALPAPTPTSEAVDDPIVRATLSMNVRSGPDTSYEIVDLFDDEEELVVVGKNEAGDWWQVELDDGRLGWVYGQLVEQVGSFDAIAVAANIPPLPAPTATPEPAPVVEAEPAPAEAEEAAPAADPSGQPQFSLVERRLWSKQENGGCAGQHLLRINVIDANGIRLNGVALQGIYIGDVLVTGDQGKGEGVIEYDLHGSGEGFFVMRNNDGREAVSDRAEGFTTRSRDISKDLLIAAGYCSDSSDCDVFYSSYGCQGHHSWEATFQRNY
jgi:uncharacterized protein YgiM (DUF1202 family)